MKKLLTLILMLGLFLTPVLAQGTYQSLFGKGQKLYNEASALYEQGNAAWKTKCDQAKNNFRLASQKTKVQSQIAKCKEMMRKCDVLKSKPLKTKKNPNPGNGTVPPRTGNRGGSNSESNIPNSQALKIVDVEFCDADKEGNNLSEYGARLFSNMQYLKAKVYFNNTVKEARRIDILVKLYRPDGTMAGGSEGNYTFDDFLRTDGQYKQGDYDITVGWGNESGSSYSPGDYRYEIWVGSKKMFTKEFTVFQASNNNSHSNNHSNAQSGNGGRGMQGSAWRTILQSAVENPSRTFGGDPYKGGLYNNDCQGFGAYFWKESDSFFYGKWNNGLRDGDGIHICGPEYCLCGKNEAAIYVGAYDNGEMATGKATLYDEYGNLLYYGNIENGKPTDTYPSTGNWSEFKFECIPCGDGAYYIGETYKGMRQGFGMYIWKNKDFWMGYWKEDKRKGSGTYVYYNGKIITGTWDGDTRTN